MRYMRPFKLCKSRNKKSWPDSVPCKLRNKETRQQDLNFRQDLLEKRNKKRLNHSRWIERAGMDDNANM